MSTDNAHIPTHTSAAQDPVPPRFRFEENFPRVRVDEASFGSRVDDVPSGVRVDENIWVDETPARPARRRIGGSRVMRTYDPEGDRVKAAVLTGALPWLREFSGRVIVVKYGGHAMVDDECRRAFAEDMVFLRT
ncbi:hypothetical protein OF117_22120, partial [Geodermatophilus sp. YIM 151500]|nr:hypothetical protein [Geodermatophilus sp. YIM 151500]